MALTLDAGWAKPPPASPAEARPEFSLFTFGFQMNPALKGSEDYRESVSWISASAQSGNALSQCLYGVLHHWGLGVPRNDEEAFHWFLSSAKQHRRAASYNVAVCYWQGIGVARDAKEASRWFNKAAQEGFLPAQKALEQIQKIPGPSISSTETPARAVAAAPLPSVRSLEKVFQGHTYRFVPEKRSWHLAKASAEKAGGYLVVIESAKENDFVASLVREAGGGVPMETWIGLSNDNESGQWTWVTGQKLDYANWNTGEPNNAGGVENFAQLGKPTLTEPEEMGRWNDIMPGWKSYYVIEMDSCP